MRNLFSAIILAAVAGASVNATEPLSLRRLYYAAATNQQLLPEFLKATERLRGSSDPTHQAFIAAALFLQAKDALNPYTRLKYFQSGKAMLDGAIAKAPGNVELRFMRLCVQLQAPPFLGYRSNVGSDKQAVIDGWDSISDGHLKNQIKQFMSRCGACSEREKALFK